MNPIDNIELVLFEVELDDLSTDGGEFGIQFAPGARTKQSRLAIKVMAKDGEVGSYVLPRSRAKPTFASTEALAHRIIGMHALDREHIYARLRRSTKHIGELGIGPLDIALWDLAGHHFDAPVSRLLGSTRESLPAYASTLHGDHLPKGLCDAAAYADFAERCLDIETVAARVGERMLVMYDAGSHLHTLADAIAIGRVCDANGLYWYEDPYADGGISLHGHRTLKRHVATPILIGEHVRNPETMTDMVVAGATDFARVDPDYDGGITGSYKAAIAAEMLGIDTEVHSCGPAMRQLMAALTHSNFYEVNLVHPSTRNAWSPPIYACGYHDELDCVDTDGNVSVPQGPGLGVEYDWPYIDTHSVHRCTIR
jgi:L-alanine-DL-glutamate epimerase-like enolase superfamily enzyme